MQGSVVSMESETDSAARMMNITTHGSDIQTQEQGLLSA
jgi:hypothetical protein